MRPTRHTLQYTAIHDSHPTHKVLQLVKGLLAAWYVPVFCLQSLADSIPTDVLPNPDLPILGSPSPTCMSDYSVFGCVRLLAIPPATSLPSAHRPLRGPHIYRPATTRHPDIALHFHLTVLVLANSLVNAKHPTGDEILNEQ